MSKQTKRGSAHLIQLKNFPQEWFAVGGKNNLLYLTSYKQQLEALIMVSQKFEVYRAGNRGARVRDNPLEASASRLLEDGVTLSEIAKTRIIRPLVVFPLIIESHKDITINSEALYALLDVLGRYNLNRR